MRLPYKYKGETRYSEDYVFRVKREGKNYYFKLGGDKKKATAGADEIWAFLAVKSHSVDQALAKYAPEKTRIADALQDQKRQPTIGEVCGRYKEKAVHLSPTTVTNNCNALRHLAAGVLGLRKIKPAEVAAKRAKWRDKVDSVLLADLTLQSLEEYRSREISEAGSDGIKRGRAITTTNSYFRCARSILSDPMMAYYDDFEIPEQVPLKQIRALREPAHRYVSQIDLEEIISKAKTRWWDGVRETDEPTGAFHRTRRKSQERIRYEERACFVILLLTAGCGLRPKEIAHLLWENIDLDNLRLTVAVTSYDTPKARNSESMVDFSLVVGSYLRQFRSSGEVGIFVLPPAEVGRSDHAKKRCGYLFSMLRAWLRQQGINHKTPLYVFRKEAGSQIYLQTESLDRAAEFLRNDPRVAREHYVGRKGRLELDLPGLEALDRD